MLEVRTFGGVVVSRDGHELALQPKRLLLLVYLLLEGRDAPVRRDQLLAVFWPEADAERARNALRQALFALRAAVGAEVIATRGSGEVCVSTASVRCDALTVLAAAGTADHAAVNASYRGEFCLALHAGDAPALERWVDDTRARFRRLVMMSVRTLRDRAGDDPAERQAILERLTMLAPYDESAAMELFAVLVDRGDRSSAVAAYRAFASRLRADLEIEPSEAFSSLVNAARVSGGVPLDRTMDQRSTDERGATSAIELAASPAASRTQRRWHGGGVLGVVAALMLAGAGLRGRVDDRLVDVVLLEHAAGDTASARYAARLTSRLRGVVAAVPGFHVREASGALPRFRTAGTLVRGGVERVDAAHWRIWATVTSAESGMLLHRTEVEGTSRDSLLAVLTDRVIAVVATIRNMDLRWGESLHRPSSLKALEQYQSAFSAKQAGDAQAGVARFEAAWRADTMFYFAGILAAGNALVAHQFEHGDSLLHELAPYESRMLPLELHQYRRAKAIARSDVFGALQESRAIVAIEPRAAFLLAQHADDAYFANRPREALRALAALDTLYAATPREAGAVSIRAAAHHMLGRFTDELSTIDATISRQPTQPQVSGLRLAPLAALGRGDSVRVMIAALASRSDGRDVGRLYLSAALELRAHGHTAQGDDLLVEGRRWLERHPPDITTHVAQGISAAELLYAAGRIAETRQLLARVRATGAASRTTAERSDILVLEGVMASHAGNRAAAMASADSLALLMTRGRNGVDTYRRARISAALGDDATAIALLEQGYQEGFSTHEAIHVEPDFTRLRRTPAFQRVTSPRG